MGWPYKLLSKEQTAEETRWRDTETSLEKASQAFA